ncbi:MAG: hypothetical protein ABI233_03330 [Chthoniobacterales bacterium]
MAIRSRGCKLAAKSPVVVLAPAEPELKRLEIVPGPAREYSS